MTTGSFGVGTYTKLERTLSSSKEGTCSRVKSVLGRTRLSCVTRSVIEGDFLVRLIGRSVASAGFRIQ